EIPTNLPEFDEAENNVRSMIDHLMNKKGEHWVYYFHKKLGKTMWNKVVMARNAQGLTEAMEEVETLREDNYKAVEDSGPTESFNQELEKAMRVADFLELGELFAKDALHREESCGGHFREEHQTEEGEAKRDDENFSYVAAWEFKGNPREAVLHKEALEYENIKMVTRSYK